MTTHARGLGRGKIRHEHRLVPSPRELRAALTRAFTSRRHIADAIGLSPTTVDALMSPFGVVRPEVIERAKAFLERSKTGS